MRVTAREGGRRRGHTCVAVFSFLGREVGKFLDPLQTEDTRKTIGGRPVYELIHQFRYIRDSGEVIVVPAGFETDFASVPRFFWRIIPPWLGRWGACVHDWCYRTRIYSRKESDAVFYECLGELCPMPYKPPRSRCGKLRWWWIRETWGVKAWLMWAAVRCFGWIAYRDRNGELPGVDQ